VFKSHVLSPWSKDSQDLHVFKPHVLGHKDRKSLKPNVLGPQIFTSYTVSVSLNVFSLYKHNVLGLKRIHVLWPEIGKS
jgi:hypothetical protein